MHAQFYFSLLVIMELSALYWCLCAFASIFTSFTLLLSIEHCRNRDTSDQQGQASKFETQL